MYSHWYKIAKIVSLDHIDKNIEATFQSLLPGEWSLIEHRKLMPSYNLQQYGSIGILGNYQVKEFLVQISYEVRKGSVGEIKLEFDNRIGNYLLSFKGFILKRPKNENTEDEYWGVYRASYEGFSDLDTPAEVANFVYDYIKRSFGSDGDSDDPIVTPPSMPPVQTPDATPSLV